MFKASVVVDLLWYVSGSIWSYGNYLGDIGLVIVSVVLGCISAF